MNRALIGLGTCGIAAGARDVHAAVRAAASAMGIDVEVAGAGCEGLCYREPLVRLRSDALGSVLYGDVRPERVTELLRAHFLEGRPLEALRVHDPAFLGPQARVVLRHCGQIDADSLDDYLVAGGYEALRRVLRDADPAGVIGEIEASGLRGRGGAGFGTGRKWALARAADDDVKYVVCNADEGDPGAFMDRNIIEGDPFAVIEGLTIAAYAIGARKGFIYVREEYPLAVERLTRALEQARASGLLGENVAGSGFAFDARVKRGAGAFVCGEETALIASLQGERGNPRLRPPFPVERGLDGHPTSINNVETYANVPWIVLHGALAYRRLGVGESRGTKVFALAGDLKRTGMVEVPMGITLREIVLGIGGGSSSGKPMKAVQIGGPSGGCLPAELFDTPVDYESLLHTGAMMGSGGLVAMDASACMVDVARYFVEFTQRESCGKCTFCRVGTRRMLEILDRLCAGHGREGDLERLERLALHVGQNSLCGLGKSAPNPVLTTLRYFRGEYEAHLERKCCPAGKCRELIAFEIDAYVCEGCTKCLQQCGSRAISTRGRLIPLLIDAELCARCGGCAEVCQFGAVMIR